MKSAIYLGRFELELVFDFHDYLSLAQAIALQIQENRSKRIAVPKVVTTIFAMVF